MTAKKSVGSKKRHGMRKILDRSIRSIERLGNHLPHPFILFIILIGLVFAVSAVLSKLGVSVAVLRLDPETNAHVTQIVTVQNLFARPIIRSIMENFVKTYAYFAPVGFVIVMVLGVSLAEQTGLFSALIRQIIIRTPPVLVTFIIAVAGICANLASDAGIIIAPTLGGAIFLAMRRHPIAGVCAGYVAAYGGFSANLFITGTDVVLAGITGSAVSHFAVDAAVHPLMNWYVMIGSTIVLAAGVTLVTEKIIVPFLGPYDPPDGRMHTETAADFKLRRGEKRGLLYVGLVTLVLLIFLIAMTMPPDSVLRNDVGRLLPNSPFISGIIFMLFTYFFIIGVVYGLASGSIRRAKDIPCMMEKGMIGVAGFLVVCLPAAVFIDLFHKSQLTSIIAVSGANLIRNFQVGHIPTILTFAVVCASLNLFITSGFTKWLLLAPIFIPMFYQLGISPAITQMAYRIGDATTDIISPVSAYLPFLLGLLEKYRNRDQQIGIGSAIAFMLPYSLILLFLWMLFLTLWLVLGLDPGPGVSLYVGG